MKIRNIYSNKNMQMLKTANFFDVYYVQVRQEQKIYIYKNQEEGSFGYLCSSAITVVWLGLERLI